VKKIILMLVFCMLLASCTAGKTVATVGNTKITTGEFEFYLSSIKNQLSGTELTTEEDWQTQEIEGKKAIDVAKQRALDIAISNVEYCEASKKAGINLTQDEKKQVEQMKNRVIESYGGKEKYKTFLKENNITDKFIELMCESTVYYSKLEKMVEEESPITEEEEQKYFDNNKETVETEYRKAKHILFLTQDMNTKESFSEEKQNEVKALADSVLKRINAGEDFDSLMREYTEDPGLETNPEGYVFGSGEMVAEFEQATDSIGFGEIIMCKSNYGYHIIKRLPISFDDVKEKIKKQVIEEKVKNQIKDWEKEYNISVKTNEENIKAIK